MSRIEQLISDIEAYIDNCKYQPFSNNKIIVDKDQLEDMLSELRLKTPDEIKKYQKILNNKDAIISDAKEQAEILFRQSAVLCLVCHSATIHDCKGKAGERTG